MKVEIIKQFSVFMPNRPGALSGLVRLFSDKGIFPSRLLVESMLYKG